jgi:hypothetical protein
MAQNYEAIREAVRLAGESKLQQLDDAFKEHQTWFGQAAEELPAAAARLPSRQPGRATRKQGSTDKVPTAFVLLHELILLPSIHLGELPHSKRARL